MEPTDRTDLGWQDSVQQHDGFVLDGVPVDGAEQEGRRRERMSAECGGRQVKEGEMGGWVCGRTSEGPSEGSKGPNTFFLRNVWVINAFGGSVGPSIRVNRGV